MRKRVYLETSVIGAYFDDRDDIVSTAQRHWTQRWWEEARSGYDVFCSDVVIDELGHPDYPRSQEALQLVEDIPCLPSEEPVSDIASVYIGKNVMPRAPIGDALHLALASHHKCDYLLTWNCRHIANPNKFERIRVVNTSLGLFVPALVTPNQLIGREDE